MSYSAWRVNWASARKLPSRRRGTVRQKNGPDDFVRSIRPCAWSRALTYRCRNQHQISVCICGSSSFATQRMPPAVAHDRRASISMRASYLAVLLVLVSATAALAETAPFHVGVARITIAAKTPFDALIRTQPRRKNILGRQVRSLFPPAESAVRARPLSGGVAVARRRRGRWRAARAARTGGRRRAARLRCDRIVHGKAGLALRPLQVTRAWDTARTAPRFTPHIDAARLSMLGFSLGTAVTLERADAIADTTHLVAYCVAQPTDVMSCDHAPDGGGRASNQSLLA